MKPIIAITLSIVLSALALPLCLQAQETIEHYSQRLTPEERAGADFSKPVNILSDQNGKYTLVFSDAAKGVVTKIIDIRENNPFSGIGEKKKDDIDDIYIPYKKKLKDVFPDFQQEPGAFTYTIADTTTIHQVLVLYGSDESKNHKYAVLAYTLIADEYLCRTMFIVYDSTATELTRFTIDNIVSDPVITDNGEYIAFTYSAWTGDSEDDQYIKSGVKIVHVADKTVIANKEVRNINGGVGTFGNFVIAGTNDYRNNGIYVTKQLFFDLLQKKVYIRELDVACLGKSKMMGDGILMQCLDGTSYKLLFSKDFIVEDML